MKRYSLILMCIVQALLLSKSTSLRADVWESYIYYVPNPDSKNETLYLYSNGLVTMSGNEYINYLGAYPSGEINDSILLLRKDEKKFFCYDDNTSCEHLLFDFGLHKGDTFENWLTDSKYEVIDVRDTLLCDSSLCMIELRGVEDNSKHDIWIDGIGSIHTGILPHTPDLNSAHLLIYDRNSTSISGEDDQRIVYFYPCDQNIKTGSMDVRELRWEREILTEEDWKAYQAWYYAPSDLNAEFDSDTLHIWGRIRTSCGIYPYAACKLHGSHVAFQVYQYDIINEADCVSIYYVDTRIPGFQKGEYIVTLLNKTLELDCEVEPVIFTAGQMATIVLPTEPDASKGKYYRLDRVEGKEIVFEQELQPHAHVPYIVVPSEDFSIELGAQEVEGLTGDTVSVEGVSFIGTYHREEINPKEGFSVRIIDTTPDCSHLPVEEQGVSLFVGALRAYLLVHWDDPYNPGGTKAPTDKMEIVLKDNPNSIRTLSNSPLKGEDIYDLSGRKLSTLNFQLSTKKKAIYIQNNRKLVK